MIVEWVLLVVIGAQATHHAPVAFLPGFTNKEDCDHTAATIQKVTADASVLCFQRDHWDSAPNLTIEPTPTPPGANEEERPMPPPDTSKKHTAVRHGFYSWQAREMARAMMSLPPERGPLLGASVYATPDGKEVTVTSVFNSKEAGERLYGWDDKVYVGPVTYWLRDVH